MTTYQRYSVRPVEYMENCEVRSFASMAAALAAGGIIDAYGVYTHDNAGLLQFVAEYSITVHGTAGAREKAEAHAARLNSNNGNQ